MNDLKNQPTTPLAYSVKMLCRQISVSPSTVWKLIKNGKLRVIRLGRRTLVSHEEAVRLMRDGSA